MFVIAQRTFFSIQMIGRAGALGSIIFSYKSFNFYALQ
nr:MAG TPA: Cas system-associated protein [Crassvirales sp.]